MKKKCFPYLERNMRDNYEYEKSLRPQDTDEYFPYRISNMTVLLMTLIQLYILILRFH